MGYSPWVRKELDTTEQLTRARARARAHTHTHTHVDAFSVANVLSGCKMLML